MTKDFDLVVIGGGPAGISGANTAGIFGKRVALVEKLHDVGGAGISRWSRGGDHPPDTCQDITLYI